VSAARLALAAVGVLAVAAPAHGQAPEAKNPGSKKDAPRKKPPEDLGKLFARRIERATGVKVRIRKLVYEVFTSTFVGRGIEAGPAGRPLLAIPELKVELVLLAKGPGTTVAMIDAHKPRIALHARWARRPYRFPNPTPATVRVARIRKGRVTIHVDGGTIALSGVDATIRNLRVPAFKAGEAPALRGEIRLGASEVKVGSLALAGLRLEGQLAHKELRVRRLRLGLPGGEVTLSGTVGLGGGKTGPGPVTLSGPFKVALRDGKGPALQGTLRLTGKSLSRLTLAGQLGPPAALPRRGGLEGAPPLDLRMKAGKRRVRGTLRRWRVR
jgi:hypothetical protein